jgi:hypothetical protein
VRLVLVLAAWGLLATSASAQSLVDDWSVRCAMFRTVHAWMADHPGQVRDPFATGDFSRPADEAFYFGGPPLPPGIPTRLGAKPSSGNDFAFGPSLRCQTLKFRDSSVDYRFNTPVIADDYGAVDLEQQQTAGPGAFNRTRFVLHKVDGRWAVLTAFTFESMQFQEVQIVWRPKAP